jgi:hypothetical protein
MSDNNQKVSHLIIHYGNSVCLSSLRYIHTIPIYDIIIKDHSRIDPAKKFPDQKIEDWMLCPMTLANRIRFIVHQWIDIRYCIIINHLHEFRTLDPCNRWKDYKTDHQPCHLERRAIHTQVYYMF